MRRIRKQEEADDKFINPVFVICLIEMVIAIVMLVDSILSMLSGGV